MDFVDFSGIAHRIFHIYPQKAKCLQQNYK